MYGERQMRPVFQIWTGKEFIEQYSSGKNKEIGNAVLKG